MNFQLALPETFPSAKINHDEKILMIGSCFSQNIGKRLQNTKFNTFINPHGIVFNPLSIAQSLSDCIVEAKYGAKNLIRQDDIWHHFNFHTSFSSLQAEEALKKMNHSVAQAHLFLKNADWLILTSGTAFQYLYLEKNRKIPVANCHKIIGTKFEKKLLSIEEITAAMQGVIENLRQINPKLKIIWTVSPVRHIKDGLIASNRSKARLLEAFHQLASNIPNSWYFPAYEILIDVLRDYRFYDHDLVHPNHLAIDVMWSQFSRQFFDDKTQNLVQKIEKIQIACRHKTQFPASKAHQSFRKNILTQIQKLEQENIKLNFEEEKELLN